MANPKSEIRNPKFLRHRNLHLASGIRHLVSGIWHLVSGFSSGGTIEDQDGSYHPVTGRDSNVEAYQVMAEIVSTVRRIVHRGLEKVSGKTWYLDGCPPGLFERLVERKENEIATDRFDDEYQELITFATLEDLAEIIEFNNDLAKLLKAIAPKNTTIADRLREIEVLRLKLEAAISFDDSDIDDLLEYHQDFREALTRGKQKAGDATPTPTPPPPQKPVEPPAEDIDTDVTEVDELRAEDVEPAPDHDAAVAEVDPPVSNEQIIDSEEALEAERAMVAEDDTEVLRVLHREVMSVAEAVYQRDLDWAHPVWEMLISRGWYDLKKADMELAPLEHFYEVAEEARKRQRAGADLDELKAYLEEAEFTKLLLALREMFMRHKL